ncbi:hypothetical protein ABKN59_005092 [Abortiporus biennis]
MIICSIRFHTHTVAFEETVIAPNISMRTWLMQVVIYILSKVRCDLNTGKWNARTVLMAGQDISSAD